MDIRNLTTFIQVAESGSFTRAGEKLGYSQPTVSVQIRQLENELGVKLFDRIGHTVRLTERGRDVLTHAQRICHMCQEMAREADEGSHPRGLIRLATADSICKRIFGTRFDEFRGRYPGISLEVTTAGTDEMFRLLDHNEVDLVCTLDSHIYNTSYVIAAEERIGVHFLISAEHPLAKEKRVPMTELIRQPFLLTEKGMSYRRLLDEQLARDSLEIQPVLEIGRADLICDLVSRGLGVSLLPDFMTETAVRQGRVVRLDVPDYSVSLWKQLLYHREKWVSPQMQAVIDCFGGILLEPSP